MQLQAAAWRCLITPGMLAALRHFVQGLIVITVNQVWTYGRQRRFFPSIVLVRTNKISQECTFCCNLDLPALVA